MNPTTTALISDIIASINSPEADVLAQAWELLAAGIDERIGQAARGFATGQVTLLSDEGVAYQVGAAELLGELFVDVAGHTRHE